MTQPRVRWAGALLLLGLLGAAVSAAAPPPSNASDEDKEFLVKAALTSRQERIDARATAKSAEQPGLQRTARSIASDHERVGAEVDALARSKGVAIPSDASGGGEAVGADSDPVRIAALLKAHEEAVALFHQEAVRGSDPEVQHLAESTLPTLQQRLRTLRQLQLANPLLSQT